MADLKARLEAFETTASEYQAQLQETTTKNDAINLSVRTVETLMEALRTASDPEEKKRLTSLCRTILGVSDRIKSSSSEEWVPPVVSLLPFVQPAHSHSPHISHAQKEYTKDVRARDLPAEGVQSRQKAFAANEDSVPTHVRREGESMANGLLTSLSRLQVAPTSPTNQRTVTTPKPYEDFRLDTVKKEHKGLSPHIGHGRQGNNASSALPAITSRSNIRKLAEPISTRKLSTKENILLLKASVVNGFKCPPWDKVPASSEFVLEAGAEPFTDVRELNLSAYQQQFFLSWERPHKTIPPPSLVSDRIAVEPQMLASQQIDLVQDAATDCSVVASMCAAIARTDFGHEQMLSKLVYPFDKNRNSPVISSNGKYLVRLNFNGCWRKVVIDDRLPLSSTHRLLHVVDRNNPQLLWPALLEKAYLKVRGGYDFPGSNSCSDLFTLTGWIPEQIYLQETDTVPDQLWKRIFNAFGYGDVLVTMGTGKMSSRQERELGLEGQHSYVVLDMKELDQDRLLLVKNPWAEGKGWRGSRPSRTSDDLSAVTSDRDPKNSRASRENPQSTTFWIGLEQAIQHFESLYLNWNPGLFQHRQDIHFEWPIKEQRVADSCLIDNPQLMLWTKQAGIVWLLLSRHFRDAPEDGPEESDAFNDGSIRPETQMYSPGEPLKGFMSLYVCDSNGAKVYMKDAYVEHGPFVNTPQSLLRWESLANSTYTIVIDQDELPASAYTFSLSAFSNSAMSLEPAISRYPMGTSVQGEWTKLTSGGNPGSDTYFENPQYMLNVKNECSVGILLTSSHKGNPMHVKLALGYGKRIYTLRKRDVLADSGNHRDDCVFAEAKDIQPGVYTIICSLFEAGQTGSFTMRVDSTRPIDLTPIPRDGAGLFPMKLAPACFAPQVNSVAAPIRVTRNANFTLLARFQRATTPRVYHVKVARSPVRLSVESGRGFDRSFLTTSENGRYSDAATVRTESFNLEPEVPLQETRWIVLDRLSGPGAPIEEWYNVELYMDVPKACEIGVWRAFET